MPNLNQGVSAKFSAAGTNTANATETVITTSQAVSSPYTGAAFLIEWVLQFTPGASTTAVTFRIRRDSLTGTQVIASPAVGVTAGVPIAIPIAAVDVITGDVASQLWVLTATQTAGAAAGTSANLTSKITTGV
jgi:hypothetical protein